MTLSFMSGEEPLVEKRGMAWVGLFDPDVWKKNDSPFYPIFYPEVSEEVIQAREKMTGHPTLRQLMGYLGKNMFINKAKMFFPASTNDGSTANYAFSLPKILKRLQVVVNVMDVFGIDKAT